MPVEGVNLRYLRFPASTVTDENGRFEIEKSQVDNDTLVSSYIGFSDQGITSLSINEEDIIINLKESVTDLKEVVVKPINHVAVLDSVIKYFDKNTPDGISYYGNYSENYSVGNRIKNYLQAKLQIESYKLKKNFIYYDPNFSFIAKNIDPSDGYPTNELNNSFASFSKKWLFEYLKKQGGINFKINSYRSLIDEKEIIVLEYIGKSGTGGNKTRLRIFVDSNYAMIGLDEHTLVTSTEDVDDGGLKYKAPQSLFTQRRDVEFDGKYFLNTASVEVKRDFLVAEYTVHSCFNVSKTCKVQCGTLSKKMKTDVLINKQIKSRKPIIDENLQSKEVISFLNDKMKS